MIQSKLKSENFYSRQQEMKKFIFGGINIFDTFKYKGYNNLPEQNLVTNFNMQFMPRYLSLTWTRSFGNDKLTGKRNHSGASDDEKNRVKSN